MNKKSILKVAIFAVLSIVIISMGTCLAAIKEPDSTQWSYITSTGIFLDKYAEYADYDVQAKLGAGVVHTGGTVTMGETDELGMNSGCLVNDGAHSMIYRGIEDIFGNVYEFIDGINIKDYQAYINYDFRTYWSDTFDGDYKPIGYVNANGFGYITKIGYDSNNPLIGLPTAVTSDITDTDYNASIKDGYISNSGERILVAGGAFNDGVDRSGLWLSDSSLGSNNYNGGSVGSRLVRHQTSGGRGVTNPQEGSHGI